MPLKKNTTPKRGAAKATRTKCDLCLAAIVDGAEDALQCEGTCQLWFHRYCAGVSQTTFKSLASSEKPFSCLPCSQERHQTTVNKLQSEVVALREQVAELRAALDSVRDPGNSSAIASLMEEVQLLRDKETKNAETWSKVVRKGKGKGKGNGSRKGSRAPSEPMECPKAHDSVPTTSHAPHPTRKRVPVENCRKVWGTLRSTSTTVVINALKQTTPSSLGPSFSIKRKFKNSQNGTTRKWWFVIRGNKPDIDLLDKEWPNVALQTGWKLEPVLCFESAESTPAQLPSSNTVLTCDESPTPTPTPTPQPQPKSPAPTNSPTITISQDPSGTSPAPTNTSSHN